MHITSEPYMLANMHAHSFLSTLYVNYLHLLNYNWIPSSKYSQMSNGIRWHVTYAAELSIFSWSYEDSVRQIKAPGIHIVTLMKASKVVFYSALNS